MTEARTQTVPTGQVNGARPHAAASFAARLDESVARSARYLLDVQYPDGYWWGELEANCSIHAEYLLLQHFMGTANKDQWRKIVNYLKSHQIEDGGWPIYHGGPGDVSIAVEAYFAMKLAGEDPDSPHMSSARDFILSKGGIPATRIFTKMWLSLFGQWDWRGTPVFPPETILLPNWFPFNIYEFASWARGTMVACMVLLNVRPVCEVPASANVDELYPLGRERTKYTFGKKGALLSWNGIFRGMDFALRVYEKSPVKPFRGYAMRKAEQWIVERQEADGSWGGIQPPWIYSLMALKSLGYPIDHPVVKKGLDGFAGFARESDEEYWTDPCISPVWDTCLALLAVEDAGVPLDNPKLVKATNWLLDEQILDHGGDWQVKRPNARPGGWAFEFENDVYPDTDDSAMVLIALQKMGWKDDPRMQNAIERGVEWLVAMQSKDGGWGAFDADNSKRWVGEIPFCDFGAVLDWPTEDVTAHCLELLGRLGYKRDYAPVRRGLDYLKRMQQADGSWWGRWGVNYVYGLGAVLPALKWVGEDMSQPYVRKAIDWLKAHQNTDGGWGEGVETYKDPSLRGKGVSTASQTGWALLGLIAANEAHSEAARAGVEWLMATQQSSGSWDEPQFTGTGFPGDFMINYHMYRDYWPLMALGQYRQAIRSEGG